MTVIMSKILISHKRVLIKCPDTPRGTELCDNTKLHFIHHLFFKHCINEPAGWIDEGSPLSYITGAGRAARGAGPGWAAVGKARPVTPLAALQPMCRSDSEVLAQAFAALMTLLLLK